MASDDYSPYISPYQQSATQQHPAYQAAPTGNNLQQTHSHCQQHTTGASRAAHYSTHPALSYTGHNGHGTGKEQSRNNTANNIYGGNRGNASRAAEILPNMSNTPYVLTSASSTARASLASANAVSSYSARYPAGNSKSTRFQTQQPYDAHACDQSHAGAQSVQSSRSQTANRVPSPAATTGYPPAQPVQTNQSCKQQQHTAEYGQRQYGRNTEESVESQSNVSMGTSGIQQQPNYNRQLPSAEASHSVPAAAPQDTSAGMQSITPMAPTAQSPATSNQATFSEQASNAVDSMAVYDPWLKHERRHEDSRTQKSIEDAKAEAKRVETAFWKTEEARLVEERRKREALGQAKLASHPKHNVPNAQHEQPGSSSDALEDEIRTIMAKMREFNGKNPALLARIWEEERRSMVNRSLTTSNKLVSQPPLVEPPATTKPSVPPVNNNKSKELGLKANKLARIPTPEPVAPPTAQALPARPYPQAVPPPSKGNTIWPLEKRTQLANAAANYLNGMNHDRQTKSIDVRRVLDGNPSYVELCEHLEGSGFRLNRALFAKHLLSAVPEINSDARKSAPQPAQLVQSAPVAATVSKRESAATVSKRESASFAAVSPRGLPVAAINANSSNRAFPTHSPLVHIPGPFAGMVPIRPERQASANKEEAARKRDLNDLVDLTPLPDDEASAPLPKRLNNNSTNHYQVEEVMDFDVPSMVNNFPTAAITGHLIREAMPQPVAVQNLRGVVVAENLDKKNALRRNSYNPSTIARDVLLACGRHPSERQLNQHLEVMRQNLPITFDSDLSTIRWDLIDPGQPPPGYYKKSTQVLAEDADDEEDEEDLGGEDQQTRRRMSSSVLGREGGARAQANPVAVNPFHKQKKRGRSRASLPNPTSNDTPQSSPKPKMSATAPRPAAKSDGIGYSAFKAATAVGPDGQSLPKRRGRPVGWRKAIHGSAAIQSSHSPVPTQSSTYPNGPNNAHAPIQIDSKSPSISSRVVNYQSYKCKWHGCRADLHNLKTLQKHVLKVHNKPHSDGTHECLWTSYGNVTTTHDPLSNVQIERHHPLSFNDESEWRRHIERDHIKPLSWELGDGPAGGLSDSHDSEAYLSDARGRRVTPRITASVRRPSSTLDTVPRGRGRLPKNKLEQDALDARERLISQKRRIGGLGMDRGGATLVNGKRRRGFSDVDDAEEELVDMED